MAVRPGYKQTEVGVIPGDWEIPILDSIAKRGSGHTPDKKHPEYWNGSIKWVSLKDSDVLDQLYIEDTEASITPAGIANSSAVVHPAGTVVMSRDAGVGKSAIMKCDMAVSQHFMAWQCGAKLNNIFLYYWLQAKKPEFERIAMGNTIKTIGLSYFRALKILNPPLPEQRAIATALSDVDALLAKLDQFITKKRDLKQASMQQLLTAQTRLPGFSGEWEVKRLGDVASFHKGKGLPKSSLTSSGSEPCIHYGELFTRYPETIGEIISKTNDSQDSFRSIANDVLMPTSDVTPRGLAKASCVRVDDVILGGDILVIRSDRTCVYGPFLSYVIRREECQVLQLVSGSTVFHLYSSDMKKFAFLMPHIIEQKAIAALLSDMDAELTVLEARRDKTRALKQGMMQELLTGKIRLV